MAKPKPKKRAARQSTREDERRVDEEVEESFPASDPPAFAGGSHSVGGPRRGVKKPGKKP